MFLTLNRSTLQLNMLDIVRLKWLQLRSRPDTPPELFAASIVAGAIADHWCGVTLRACRTRLNGPALGREQRAGNDRDQTNSE